MNRIADNPTRTKHSEEIAFLNALVIDLKRLCAYHNALHVLKGVGVDMDRLNDATFALDKLSQCKER